METFKKMAPAHYFPDLCFLGILGILVWLGLLSLNRLALGHPAQNGCRSLAQFLCQLFATTTHGDTASGFVGGLSYPRPDIGCFCGIIKGEFFSLWGKKQKVGVIIYSIQYNTYCELAHSFIQAHNEFPGGRHGNRKSKFEQAYIGP